MRILGTGGGDNLYMDPNLCKLVRSHHMHIIAVLRNDDRDLLVDARSLFGDLAPTPLDDEKVRRANGKSVVAPYVGPVQIGFKDRIGFSAALVMRDEVLLGAIPTEDTDFIVLPKDRRLDVDPARPNVATSIAK